MALEPLTIDRNTAQRYLEQAFEHAQAELIVGFAERYGMPAIREDFRELKGVVQDLTEAQRCTEERLGQLAQAQERTEERLGQLAQAQERTEERLDRLAQAQERTEGRLDRLAQAQERTEGRLDRLAQAQERTEVALQNLARQVGGLSDRMGGDFEDIGAGVVYSVLTQDLGWNVLDLEPRAYQRWNGIEEEVDLFGRAEDPAAPGQTVWLVGETKHNLTAKDVERFAKLVARARQHVEGEVFPFCFCYRARPEVRQAAKAAHLNLVFSNAKLVRARD